jgi:hypothetical protein
MIVCKIDSNEEQAILLHFLLVFYNIWSNEAHANIEMMLVIEREHNMLECKQQCISFSFSLSLSIPISLISPSPVIKGVCVTSCSLSQIPSN